MHAWTAPLRRSAVTYDTATDYDMMAPAAALARAMSAPPAFELAVESHGMNVEARYGVGEGTRRMLGACLQAHAE